MQAILVDREAPMIETQLSQSVIDELERERARLLEVMKLADQEIQLAVERMNAAKEKITGINALLGNKIRSQDSENGDRDAGKQDDQRRGALGHAIKRILARSERALTPKEVTELLEKKRYPYSGKAPLRTRVGGELWRLRKMGEVIKRRGGRYRLPKE